MSKFRRNHGIDALRTLAILGMMAAHTSRLVDFQSRREWSRVTLLLEPVIPSLFLFLVGLSMVYSHARAQNQQAWFFRHARRAVGLWLVSCLFFALEHGIRLPDVFIASGILCTIAYSIVLIGAILCSKSSSWILGILLGLATLAFYLFDRAGSNSFPLVSGNSPLLPLCLFALAGSLWGIMMFRIPRAVSWIVITSLLFATWMIWRYGWESLFAYPLGRSDATRMFAPTIAGAPGKTVGYYNLKPLLALLCLALHLGALGILSLIPATLKSSWLRHFFALGRHSLEVYVLHLFLLAMLVVVFGPHPIKSSWEGDVVLAGVVVICLAWIFLQEKLELFGKLKLFVGKPPTIP